MKILSYEQAEEALNAIADFCEEQDGHHLFAVMGDGIEETSSIYVGTFKDIIPSICMALISDSELKDVVEEALRLSSDKDIVKAYWQANPQNIKN